MEVGAGYPPHALYFPDEYSSLSLPPPNSLQAPQPAPLLINQQVTLTWMDQPSLWPWLLPCSPQQGHQEGLGRPGTGSMVLSLSDAPARLPGHTAAPSSLGTGHAALSRLTLLPCGHLCPSLRSMSSR